MSLAHDTILKIQASLTRQSTTDSTIPLEGGRQQIVRNSMGKKSRGKRERKLAQMSSDPSFLLRKMLGLREQNAGRMSLAKPFCERLEATRALFRQYQRLDTAIALGVSEL